jgi:hypothetical protein
LGKYGGCGKYLIRIENFQAAAVRTDFLFMSEPEFLNRTKGGKGGKRQGNDDTEIRKEEKRV